MQTVERLDKYCQLFLQWLNFNNIASRNTTISELRNNIEDSLKGVELLKEEQFIADIGTGGGFPGIPLAIFLPDSQFTLVEANRKKCSFLRLVKQELFLHNVKILNERLENLEKFPCIVSKAAFSLKNIQKLVQHVSVRGKAFLWSTPKMEDDLKKALWLMGFELFNKNTYNIGNTERTIFIFKHY